MSLYQATVSHDMRAPANAIEIMVDNLLKRRSLKIEYRKLLNPIRYASNMLKCQINSQLDYNLILKKKFKMS